MKPRLLFSFVFIVFFSGCSFAQRSYNLSLDQLDPATHMAAGWGFGNVSYAMLPADKTKEAFKLDSVVKHDGKYSLLIDWNKDYGEWTATNYAIRETFKGHSIKLTGYLKTENVTGTGAGLWMRIDGTEKNLAFDNMMKTPVTGTTDWKQYSIELDYDDENAETITVGGLIVGEGKLWMDDLHISIDGKDITKAEEKKRVRSKAELDTAFSHSSGIANISLDAEKEKLLANLGMIWGFIKYYHPAVAEGNYNMDAELFRILPKVMDAKKPNDAYAVIEKWVDGFGKPAECKNCGVIEKTFKVKIMPDYGYLFDKGNLPQSLVDKLNYILKNRGKKTKNYYVALNKGVGNPNFMHELLYIDAPYPDAGIRLLALYRYWNMIQYFDPNRHLIGEDWNKVLTESIPDFVNAKDTLDYDLACLKLIARIHDTHANIWGGADALRNHNGLLTMPVAAEFIDDKLVVTDFYPDEKNKEGSLQRGDIIEKIDGVPVKELVKKNLSLTPASNYETQLRDLSRYGSHILRSNIPEAKLDVLRGDKNIDVTVYRITIEDCYNKYEAGITNAKYKILDNNIGYIYPAKLNDSDFEEVKNKLNNTKGLIIDMRCYPSTFMTFTYAKWLKRQASPFVVFTNGSIENPGLFTYSDPLENGYSNSNYYAGKIVIIVNATTQSSAEYQTMALSTAPDVTVIGSQTAGADGNVSEIMLPGGIRTMVSGIGILYPDGTESQRKGVKIDVVVKPTIKGIKEGKDELLDKAIEIINKS
jgi:hypothetical protein